jgi:O-acetyl-ADP-ribose deacetylase (regulator of RNase III)
MTQAERLEYLISELSKEYGDLKQLMVDGKDRRALLRAYMNIRMPKTISNELMRIQDEYLQEELKSKGRVPLEDIPTIREEYRSDRKHSNKISLWQGDITRLGVDAIVNAANSRLLGCFVPCHRCIDNAIHSAAGMKLREECHHIMERQGDEEDTGKAKITKAYNLPCKHVIHTVGPIVSVGLTKELEQDLSSCYESCLSCAVDHGVRSIAFCCISTGEFHFPQERAAEIAIETVIRFLSNNEDQIDRVVFNVYQDTDYKIYREILNINRERY